MTSTNTDLGITEATVGRSLIGCFLKIASDSEVLEFRGREFQSFAPL